MKKNTYDGWKGFETLILDKSCVKYSIQALYIRHS